VLTINGRVEVYRRHFHSLISGSQVPADERFNHSGTTITVGVREMGARLNNDTTSFDRAAENLERTAQISISGERLRQMVQTDGRLILAAQQANEVAPAFTATDCLVDPVQPDGATRIYNGVDGVMVPMIMEQEKQRRRETVEQNVWRRVCRSTLFANAKRVAMKALRNSKPSCFMMNTVHSGMKRCDSVVVRRQAK